MEKSFTEDAPILSKYRNPATKVDQATADETALRSKRLLKEKIRSQGRVKPVMGNEQYERDLVLIATKGVVQLFNTVSEF